MSDGVEPLARVGIEPLAPGGPPARVRRDERNEQGKREQPRGRRHEDADEDEDEDDGFPHVDVRA